MARALVEGRQRTRRLRKIQIHCEDALGQAVMEFAAEATSLFVLQLQQARGKLMERLFGLFALGDVRKRVDYCGNGPVRRKLWQRISESKELRLNLCSASRSLHFESTPASLLGADRAASKT